MRTLHSPSSTNASRWVFADRRHCTSRRIVAARGWFCTLLALAFLAWSMPAGANGITIWHIPHPDDETLGMAGGILAAAAEGQRNIVVFYTRGGASSARLILNGLVHSPIHGRRLDPRLEGYAPLSIGDLKAARMAETFAALAHLGVPESDIIALDLPDGAVTVRQALDVMERLDLEFPGAAHRTTSLHDPHPDHQSLARALLLFSQAESRQGVDIGFYRVYQYDVPLESRHEHVIAVPVADPERKAAALAEFGVWDPPAGRFAVGYLSVARLFTQAAADPYEYMDPVPEQVPALISRTTDLGLDLHTSGIDVNLRLRGGWALRLGTSLDGVLSSSVIHKFPLGGYGVRLYLGPGISLPTDGPRIHWLVGAEALRSLLLEYRTGQTESTFRLGLRFRL